MSQGAPDRSDGIGEPRNPLRRFRTAPTIALATPSEATVIAVVADRLVPRLAGLAGVEGELAPALLIPRCRSVHTAWMRFALDIAFLDVAAPEPGATAGIRSVHASVPRRRLVSAPRRSRTGERRGRIATLELVAGSAARLGIEPGRTLEIGAAPR